MVGNTLNRQAHRQALQSHIGSVQFFFFLTKQQTQQSMKSAKLQLQKWLLDASGKPSYFTEYFKICSKMHFYIRQVINQNPIKTWLSEARTG